MKYYIASSYDSNIKIKNIEKVENRLAEQFVKYYSPRNYFVPNTQQDNGKWGRSEFEKMLNALKECDGIVCLYYGHESDSTTSFILGFAYAMGMPTIVINMYNNVESSYAVINAATVSIDGIASIKNYDFIKLPPCKSSNIQK